MKKTALTFAIAATLAMPAPVAAEPSFGIGLTYIFGEGLALGARVFSTDTPERGAMAIGIDYKFASGTWRPNIGVAYLDKDVYVDFSIGLDLQTRVTDFGIGLGGLGGMETPAAPAAAPAPAATTTTTTTTAPPPPPPPAPPAPTPPLTGAA